MPALRPSALLRILGAAALVGHCGFTFATSSDDADDVVKQLIGEQCGACHYVPGIPLAQGHVGPSLAGIARQEILAGFFSNTRDNMIRLIEHPQQALPGNAMPEMNLSREQVLRIVDYLYTLQRR